MKEIRTKMIKQKKTKFEINIEIFVQKCLPSTSGILGSVIQPYVGCDFEFFTGFPT